MRRWGAADYRTVAPDAPLESPKDSPWVPYSSKPGKKSASDSSLKENGENGEATGNAMDLAHEVVEESRLSSNENHPVDGSDGAASDSR